MIFTCPVCNGIEAWPWLETPDRYHGQKVLYQLVRCPECSAIWLYNAPETTEMAAHYGQSYHRDITRSGERRVRQRWKEHCELLTRLASPGTILDIGCSSGSFLKAMKSQGWQPVGIEIDPKVAEMARCNTGGEVYCGDAPDAPFPAASFDVITCVHTLEHQFQPRELMAKAWYWLRPGGLFYVVVPNIDSWEFQLFRSYWYALEVPRHLTFFSPTSLRRIGAEAGFYLEWMTTRTDCHLEASTKYVLDAVREKIGLRVKPLADASEPAIPWRMLRKVIRLTGILAFRQIASASGHGASLAVVFRKPISAPGHLSENHDLANSDAVP